jgi:hypothetical protein
MLCSGDGIERCAGCQVDTSRTAPHSCDRNIPGRNVFAVNVAAIMNARSLAEEPIVRLILDGTVIPRAARPQGDLDLAARCPRRARGRPEGAARDQEHGWRERRNAGNPLGEAVVWYVSLRGNIEIRCFVPVDARSAFS